MPAVDGILRLACGEGRHGDHGDRERACRDLHRAVAARAIRRDGEAAPGRVASSVRLDGGRSDHAYQSGRRRARATPHPLAEFERDLIRTRTSEGRARAKAQGVKLGRKLTLTPHQKKAEAIKRRDKRKESPAAIARSYNVSRWRRIAGARERQGARVFEREGASPAFGHDWTHDLLSFAGLQAKADAVPQKVRAEAGVSAPARLFCAPLSTLSQQNPVRLRTFIWRGSRPHALFSCAKFLK